MSKQKLSPVDILNAGISLNLGNVALVISSWRNRRWRDSLRERKQIDVVSMLALTMLERAYPGKVWCKLTQCEGDQIDAFMGSGKLEPPIDTGKFRPSISSKTTASITVVNQPSYFANDPITGELKEYKADGK